MGKAKVDEKVYGLVKRLSNSGATQREIQEYVDLSTQTIRLIIQSDDYEGYREKINFHGRITPVKEAPPTQTVVPQIMASQYQTNRMIEMLNKQIELLTTISAKLAFVVDELTK